MSERIDLPDLDALADLPDESPEGEGAAATSGRAARLLGLPAVVRARLAVPAPLGRVLGRVPLPILTGAGSALAVVLAALIVAGLSGRPGSAAVAHGADVAEHAVNVVDEHDEPLILPTPRPPPTRRPDPTATPTPPAWQPREGGGWVGVGMVGPDRLALLRPENLFLVDDARESFTMTVRFAILVATGDLRPWWGVLLSYQDPMHNSRIEFFSDSYDEWRPYVALHSANGNAGGPLEQPSRVSGLDFWGRDTHELKVQRSATRVRAQLNGRTIKTWTTPPLPTGDRKGLFVWGNSRMRVESFSVE